MTQRYWVVGGDYSDCQFSTLVPGTEQIAGPFGDEGRARREWTRLTFRDQACPNAMRRYAIASEAVN